MSVLERGNLRPLLGKPAAASDDADRPSTIVLTKERDLPWRDRAAVGALVSQLRQLGFKPVGNFRIEEVPDLQLVGLGHPDDGFGAVVYEHQQTGETWCELKVVYHSRTSLTVTSAVPADDAEPPFAPRVHLKRARPAKLHEALCREIGAEPLVPVTPASFKQLFEESWAREHGWRIDQGDDAEPPNPLGGYPLANEAQAARLGFDRELFRWLVEKTPESLHHRPFDSWALRGQIDPAAFPGTIRPDPQDDEGEILTLEVLATTVPASKALLMVRAFQGTLRPRGVQCLRTGEQKLRGKALIVFFKHPSPAPILWARQTNGADHGLDTPDILLQLRRWHTEHGLRLLGAGFDWVDVDIERPPADAASLAAEIVAFCPDVVRLVSDKAKPRAEAIAAVAERLQRRQPLHLWWD